MIALSIRMYTTTKKDRRRGLSADFRQCAPIPALAVFLGDNGGDIAGIPQSRALGTTLDTGRFATLMSRAMM